MQVIKKLSSYELSFSFHSYKVLEYKTDSDTGNY